MNYMHRACLMLKAYSLMPQEGARNLDNQKKKKQPDPTMLLPLAFVDSAITHLMLPGVWLNEHFCFIL